MAALAILLAGGAIAVVASVQKVADGIDLADLTPKKQGATSVVYAADGKKLGYFQTKILRQAVPRSDMSPLLRKATVAVEDKRFFLHAGVDVEGVFRAALRNASAKESREGASTLEMQLIRNLYTEDRTQDLKRKIREAKLAQQLEEQHPGRDGKEWILTKYLNTAPYGNAASGLNIYGVQAASRVYFGKSAKDLTLAQAAMIAGLPQAPGRYNPYRAPENALERRNEVLKRMADQGYIKASEAVEAQDEPLGIRKDDEYYLRKREQFFMEYVQQKLITIYGRDAVESGGLKVYTTINLKKQRAARAAINAYIRPELGDPASAIVDIDPRNGNLEAMASSQRFENAKFDLTWQSNRQAGSTFKPIVLAAALDQGIGPKTTFPAPGSIPCLPSEGVCKIKNFSESGGGGGSQDLVTATLKSTNTVYAQLTRKVGPRNVVRMARKLGVTNLNKVDEQITSIGLGGNDKGVSPMEMARAYATLANHGRRNKIRSITKVVFPGHRVRRPQPVKPVQTVDRAVADEVSRILQKNLKSGTPSSANFGCPGGAKTGTTDKGTNVWLDGFTPRQAVAVWVGRPKDQQPIGSVSYAGNIQGATVAGPIWKRYFQLSHGSFCGGFSNMVPYTGGSSDNYSTDGSTNNSTDSGSGSDSTSGDDSTPNYTGNSGSESTATASVGGTKYPSDKYESAPQSPSR